MLKIQTIFGHAVSIRGYSIVNLDVVVNGEAVFGNGCSIGANAFIRDVVIGDNVILGVSSCIVKNVDPNVSLLESRLRLLVAEDQCIA